MNLEDNFGSVVELNPDHKDIFIFGGGYSNDLFFLDEKFRDLSRENAIIITCNGAISQIKPTFQICGDNHAIKHWSRHSNNDTSVLWVASPRGQYANHPVSSIPRSKFFASNFKWYGTGHEAFALAFCLCQWHGNIKRIYYIGFDFSEFSFEKSKSNNMKMPPNLCDKTKQTLQAIAGKGHFCYPNRGEVMPYQKQIVAPYEWWKYPIKIHRSDVAAYKRHYKGICGLKNAAKFMKLLVCKSVVNIKYLDDNKPDLNFEVAKKHGVLKELQLLQPTVVIGSQCNIE